MGSTPVPGTYSASRVSAILGLNQYTSPFEAWQIIMEERQLGFNAARGYKLPDPPDSAAVRWGHAFEDAIIKLAEEKAQTDITHREKLFQADIFQGASDGFTLSCHVDGVYNEQPVTIHEGKTTNIRAYTSARSEIKESLNEDGELEKDFELKRKWGDPETDQVPQEYQCQAAVQRICSGAELVKLSVLVFEKPVDDYEEMGYRIGKHKEDYTIELLKNDSGEYDFYRWPIQWATVFRDIGNFHTYNLPSHPELEAAIISTIQNFHEQYVMTETPPPFSMYDDVKRYFTNPVGTVIADPNVKTMVTEYSEITRQIGSSGPLAKRRDQLKIDIMNSIRDKIEVTGADTEEAKIVILDPNGGFQLASLSVNKNGALVFRSKKA